MGRPATACAALGLSLGVAALSLSFGGCSDGSTPAVAGGASTSATGSYVDEASCVRCHSTEAQLWAGSHHDLAMQPATEATVLGDFDDVEFVHGGETTRFFREGADFRVRAKGPTGEPEEFVARYVFGVEPLQQLLLELPGGRMQALSVAWDTERGEWFHLYPDEDTPYDDPLHWSGRYQTWNAMCAECHSTNLVKAYDAEARTYETTWDVIDVGCQACHGPGSEHVAWAGMGDADSSAANAANKGLVVDFEGGDAEYQVDQCARCHARRHRVAPRHVAGRPFLDEYMPELLREGLYHVDGQILDEVYVYGSFVQSRMYAKGVRCSDCHDPHALDLKVENDAVCLQCHSLQAPLERFPSLQVKKYDTPEHHHHPEESEGARCVSCHMPAKNYMVVDPRRDHSFRIPRPDLSAELETPNACSGCHVDQTPQWAAEAVASWGGEPPAKHYGEAIAAGRLGRPGAIEALTELALDPEAPAIARATALELLSMYGNLGLPALAAVLNDEQPLIRAIAAEGLESAPAEALIEMLGPLLDDDVRAVRTAAARSLASVPLDALGTYRASFETGLADYLAAQEEDADMPAAHLNLAVLRARQGRGADAERRYRLALELDPFFLPARFNLANQLNGRGRNEEAEKVLREGLRRTADEGELHYSLGLLLAEMERIDEAAVSLRRAAELLPGRSLQPRARVATGR
jgi:tetratricopeptide (TPR) repeat protein